MEILKIDLGSLGKGILQKAAAVIQSDGVIVVPTDTVYGLACDASNEKAMLKIFQIKKRDVSKPLGIFVGDIAMAKKYARIKKTQEKYFKAADTFIVPLKEKLPLQEKTIGIRIPRSRLILTLLSMLQIPLAQTSANISGQPSTNSIKKIIKTFTTQSIQPDLVLSAGDLPARKPSRVIDLTGESLRVLRK